MHAVVNALTVRPGGGLTVVSGVVQGLRQAAPDWEITVLTSDGATHKRIVQDSAADRVERLLPGSSAARLFVWQNTRLGRWLRKGRADALVTVNHYVGNVSCPQVVYHLNLLRFCGKRPFKFGRGGLQESLRDWMARAALRRASANVFESHHLKEAAEAANNGPSKNGSVIHIGLPEELIALNENLDSRLFQRNRLVAVTSPHPHKDNETLVRTLAELVDREQGSDWRLDIAGGVNPEDWVPTEVLAEKLGVRQRICFHGFCNNAQLTSLLQKRLCLVLTSRCESFAMVALEAMARRCPPVVSNCASMPESIGPAGLLAEPGNPSAFADAIQRLSHSPELRAQLVDRGNAWIRRFRWTRCGAAFRELLEGIHAPAGTQLVAAVK